MTSLVMLALTTLANAIFWFSLYLFDLAVIGFAGPDLVVDVIHKILSAQKPLYVGYESIQSLSH